MTSLPTPRFSFSNTLFMAQMIALLTSWSVLAVHRVLSFELPLLGGQFVLVRLASSLILPVIAGVISALFWW